MKLFKEVDYENSYSKIDGVKALVAFVLMGVIQYGISYLEICAVNANIIKIHANIRYAFCLLVVVFAFVGIKKVNTIGITKHKILLSIVLGVVLGVILAACRIGLARLPEMVGYNVGVDNKVQYVLKSLLIVFTEEIVFRGFIGTRLCGFFKNHIVSSAVTAVLFALYVSLTKVFLLINGFIPPYMGKMILMAVLLHFSTDFIYKLTNNIWGAVVARIICLSAGVIFVLQF